jgi:hypothetical protein
VQMGCRSAVETYLGITRESRIGATYIHTCRMETFSRIKMALATFCCKLLAYLRAVYVDSFYKKQFEHWRCIPSCVQHERFTSSISSCRLSGEQDPRAACSYSATLCSHGPSANDCNSASSNSHMSPMAPTNFPHWAWQPFVSTQ